MKTFIENISDTKSIKFSSFTRTNDPLEFLKYVHYTHSTWDGITVDEPNHNLKYGRKINDIIKNKSKLFCSSIDISYKDFYTIESRMQNNVSTLLYKGFCKPRMWAQYAENHKGVCLIFDKYVLTELVKQYTNENINGSRLYFSEINYDNELNGLKQLFDLSKFNEKLIDDYIDENISKYYFQKLEDYRDESEYRFVIKTNDLNKDDYIYIPYNNALVGIIITASFPKAYYVNLESYSKLNDVPLFLLYWQNGDAAIYDYFEVKKYKA